MKYHLLSILILICVAAHTQDIVHYTTQPGKPPLDTSVFENWSSVINPSISDDGKYVFYTVRNEPRGQNSIIVQQIGTAWQMNLINARSGNFAHDNRQMYFVKNRDSLCLLNLLTSSFETVGQATAYQLINTEGNEWLVYQVSGRSSKDLVVENLTTKKRVQISEVQSYYSASNGTVLLLTKKESGENALTAYDLTTGIEKKIWSAQNASVATVTLDKTAQRVAFLTTENKQTENACEVWYDDLHNDAAAIRLTTSTLTENELSLTLDQNSLLRFSDAGERLFLSLKERPLPKPKPDAVKVDVWSYSDVKLQSRQLSELQQQGIGGRKERYTAILSISDHHIVRLDQKDETLRLFPRSADKTGFIIFQAGEMTEWNWNPASKPSYFLISLITGERKSVKMRMLDISPSGKYAIGTDDSLRDYYSYDLATGAIHNLTHSLPIPLYDTEFDDVPGLRPRGLKGIADWLPNDSALLVYDKYDIWQLDPSGKRRPVCITAGYGRKNQVSFYLLDGPGKSAFERGDTMLLCAFNKKNKDNGFYQKVYGQPGEPKKLSMGPSLFYADFSQASFQFKFPPLKAKNANVFLIVRASTSSSPNYFYTSDFRQFHEVSNCHPENRYNWLTSELVNWKTFSGRSAQGVLYKPEDFNPQKKYPLIVYFYERLSDELHVYRKPEPASGPINIPWFVSHGYLVFTPDVYFTAGIPGKSAYDYIVSGVKHLTNYSWIDANKIGIQGHSMGGFEVNYLVTHTNIFAAAMSASGECDFISGYGSLRGSGESNKYFYEIHQCRVGATLWQKPELYFENSPVLRADKVKTPLLLMNNKEDAAIPFSQGVEFFTALRRLRKKCWMFQYDGEVHSVSGKAALDYTIRMTQFFDHYLKGAPSPKWMTQGIEAAMKGIDDGFKLEDKKTSDGKELSGDYGSNQ